MIPLIGLFRGGFLLIVLVWYSVSVWQAMDGYFRDEFKKYLDKEFEKNKHMKADIQGKAEDKLILLKSETVNNKYGEDYTMSEMKKMDVQHIESKSQYPAMQDDASVVSFKRITAEDDVCPIKVENNDDSDFCNK